MSTLMSLRKLNECLQIYEQNEGYQLIQTELWDTICTTVHQLIREEEQIIKAADHYGAMQ